MFVPPKYVAELNVELVWNRVRMKNYIQVGDG